MPTSTIPTTISSISHYRTLVSQMADNAGPYRTDAERESSRSSWQKR